MIEITSNKNPTVKEIKNLSKKRNRWKDKSFIIEGLKMVEEAIREDIHIDSIVFNHSFLEAEENKDFIQQITDKYKTIKINDDIFKEISDTETPQGILSVVKFNIKDLASIEVMEDPVLLFLDEIQDPGNLGTIIRSADAFNIEGIIIGLGTVDPYNSKVVRATMGSIFRVPLYFCENSIECIDFLKDKSFKIVGTSPQGEAIYDYENIKGTVFVIGNEARGVNPEIIHKCNKNIKIPMTGRAESLNAGVAASIIMYESMKNKSLKYYR